MNEQVDVKGLSCPQPVVQTRKKMLDMKRGILEILVDTGTSRDNITRLAEKEGWRVEVEEKGDEYVLILSKS